MENQGKKITEEELTEELKLAVKDCFTGSVRKCKDGLHLFLGGQMFVLTVKEHNPEKITPVK